MLYMVVLLSSCAGNGNVIETSGTPLLPDAAVARVTIPNALTLLTVNGEKVPASRSRDSYQVRLVPGPRRLRIAYEEDWGKASDYDWVYSDHVVEVVLTARAGVVYRMGYPVPANRSAARRLAGDLRVWIDEPDGTRVESRQVTAHGLPLTRLISIGAAASAPDAPDTAAAAVAAAPGGDKVDQAEALLAEQDALQRLKLWWKLASDAQRQQFQAWIETR